MSRPSRELVDTLYADEVRAARAMSPGEKFWAGPRLFDYACEVARAGIRMQHPEADEARVEELLRARIALGRRLEGRR